MLFAEISFIFVHVAVVACFSLFELNALCVLSMTSQKQSCQHSTLFSHSLKHMAMVWGLWRVSTLVQRNLSMYSIMMTRFSSFWTTVAIFLVSQMIWELAIEIFFWTNHFVILPFPSWDLHFAGVNITAFFKWLPAHASKYLQSLRWILCQVYLFMPWESDTPDWSSFLKLVAGRVDLPKLRLHLDMATYCNKLNNQ